jgi:hypothetical protein
VKFAMADVDGDGDGDEGFSEFGAMDGVGSDLLRWRQLTDDGCSGQKIEKKPIRLQQRSWDAGTEVTPSTEATDIKYDRWAYGINV